jgi:GNAT superfamily N-acetyltransferase
VAGRYGLSIRSADAGDADAIAQLLGSSGKAVGSGDLSDRLEAIKGSSGAVLLAVEWGPPSGVIALSWHAVLTPEKKIAFVSLLLVDREQRRRGIARLLLKAASQVARTASCSELRLSPPAQAEHLHAFCTATGFTETGLVLTRPLRKRP